MQMTIWYWASPGMSMKLYGPINEVEHQRVKHHSTAQHRSSLGAAYPPTHGPIPVYYVGGALPDPGPYSSIKSALQYYRSLAFLLLPRSKIWLLAVMLPTCSVATLKFLLGSTKLGNLDQNSNPTLLHTPVDSSIHGIEILAIPDY